MSSSGKTYRRIGCHQLTIQIHKAYCTRIRDVPHQVQPSKIILSTGRSTSRILTDCIILELLIDRSTSYHDRLCIQIHSSLSGKRYNMCLCHQLFNRYIFQIYSLYLRQIIRNGYTCCLSEVNRQHPIFDPICRCTSGCCQRSGLLTNRRHYRGHGYIVRILKQDTFASVSPFRTIEQISGDPRFCGSIINDPFPLTALCSGKDTVNIVQPINMMNVRWCCHEISESGNRIIQTSAYYDCSRCMCSRSSCQISLHKIYIFAHDLCNRASSCVTCFRRKSAFCPDFTGVQ